MDVEAPAAFWPPRVGDYARVKHGGPLGEVIDASRGREGHRYVLNLFTPNPDAPPVYRLEDLEPIWPGRPARDAPSHGTTRHRRPGPPHGHPGRAK
jgi:hypothetical protein